MTKADAIQHDPKRESDDLRCHQCEYDLRAHDPDGICPECGGSVAEARRWAAIARRSSWRDADPRWRRRMLAGCWVLVLTPLLAVLHEVGWSNRIEMPTFRKYGGFTLDESLLKDFGLYPTLLFCIGMVLLFSKEVGRRPRRTDWTRRWGVLCVYVVAFLSAASFEFIAALVVLGLAALFLSMPLQHQPAVTMLLVRIGTELIWHGPQARNPALYVLIVFSACTVLLACVQLWNALAKASARGATRLAVLPLALFAVIMIVQVVLELTRSPIFLPTSLETFATAGSYFRPAMLFSEGLFFGYGPPSPLNIGIELSKWLAILSVALRLSVAEVSARRARSSKAGAGDADEPDLTEA